MMKLLLINPLSQRLITSDNPEFIEESHKKIFPLGILYIAAVARQQSAWTVEVLDCEREKLSGSSLEDRIKIISPDMVGLSVLTFTAIDVRDTLHTIKTALPKTTTVLGGPHAHIYPEETIRWKDVDIVVLGEGEMVMPGLLQSFPNRKKMRSVRGLLFKECDGSIVNTQKPDLIADLDNLPFPARDLIDVSKYSSILTGDHAVTSMITSRGCPYKCKYCHRPHLGKNFRAHSPEYVVAEMQACQSLGIKEILIYDDTFTVNKQRVLDICNLIIKSNLNVKFDIRTRVDTVDLTMLLALKKAGCERIHYGIETGTPKIQRILGKNLDLNKAREVFKATAKLKLKTLAYFMIGSPKETLLDINESINLAIKLNPDFLSITILTPFPATEIYTMALKDGVIKRDYFRDFAKNPTADFKVKYWEAELTKDQLYFELKKAYRRFYARPRFLLRQLIMIRSYKEFVKKFLIGLKVLGII